MSETAIVSLRTLAFFFPRAFVLSHGFLLIFEMRLRHLVVPELSSFLLSSAYFGSEHLEELFLSGQILLAVELVLVEIQHIRDVRSPNPVVEHKLVTEAQ